MRTKDKAKQRFLEFIGFESYQPPEKLFQAFNPSKIVVFPDPHEPYSSQDVWKHAVTNHGDAVVAIVTGDLGDYYSKSRFGKQRHQNFQDELRAVFLRMEWLSTHFRDVRIMVGNHDNRPEKKIQALLGDMSDLFILTEPNLLEFMSGFFDNVRIVGIQVNLLGINEIKPKLVSHIYQHGDIIFTHAEKSNVKRETTLENISKWVRGWSQVLGLKPYRFICQSHNHADMKTTCGIEKWMLLPTCTTTLSFGTEYILHPKMVGNPPCVGYSVFYQTNRVTDYNLSGNILI